MLRLCLPGAGITFSNIRNRQMTLTWGAATDDASATGSLQYKLVKDDNTVANINSIPSADTKAGADLLQDWTAGLTGKNIAGLTGSKLYHFALLVRDTAGNIAMYTTASQQTTTWEASPIIMNRGRHMHTATLLNDGRILVVGGNGMIADTPQSAEIIDLQANSGSGNSLFTTSLPTAGRANHTATA
ncbi:MAG: hypothetical protein U1F16_08170 [Turneriella sp.]